MEIRYIAPADDRMAISRIYEESWKYAYKGIIPQDYLDSIPEGHWAAHLDNADMKTLVCMDDDRFVGTSSFCKSRFGRLVGWGEVVSIYLLPDYMGKGYGRFLLDAAISELKNMGHRDVFLWVLEENTRARRFYEKAGFLRTDDSMTQTIGDKDLLEIRYVFNE